MKTASFFQYSGPNGISIARWAPKIFNGPSHPALAPGSGLLKRPYDDYHALYLAQLASLDPKAEWESLIAKVPGEPVLLCWEHTPFKPGVFCHRRMVADWFYRTLGHSVQEYTQENLPVQQLILYTDGGCRPNPGQGGWGVHGYAFNSGDSQGSGCPTHKTTNYGYMTNAEFKDMDVLKTIHTVCPQAYYNFAGPCEFATNNQMEITALLEALKFFKDEPIETIRLYTDSEYVVNIVKLLPVYASKQWTKQSGEPIQHLGLWQSIHQLMTAYQLNKVSIAVSWVKGHHTNLGNHYADLQATLGIRLGQLGHEAIYRTDPAKNYWKVSATRHPFLHFKRLYYSHPIDSHVPGHYFLAQAGKTDDTVGRQSSDTAYSAIRLKTPDPQIETLMRVRPDRIEEQLLLLRVDRIYQKDVVRYLNIHKDAAVLQSTQEDVLEFLDRTPMVYVQRPPGLCLRAVDASMKLNNRLDAFILKQSNHLLDPGEYIQEITDWFYDFDKKPQLKKSLKTGTAHVKGQIQLATQDGLVERPCTLSLGRDLIDRNALKQLEAEHPKLFLYSWAEGPQSYRYVTIIQTNEAIGIWSHWYASLVFLSESPLGKRVR